MLRIAHVLSTPAGLAGAEFLVAELARHSQAAGHHVVVLNVFEDPAMGPVLAQACAPVPVHAATGHGLRDLPRLRRWLEDRLRDERPDVVHVHLARALVLGATLRRRPGRALLVTHHHGELFAQQNRPAARRLERLALRRYGTVVAVSPAVSKVVVDDLGVPAAKVRCITNGWQGAPRTRTPIGATRIVCVAQMRREKGHEVLLRAMPVVRRQAPDAELHLIGDGPLRPHLERLATELGLGTSVVFRGHLKDVWPELAAATVVAQPSLVEPFGIAALEAMAAGAPLVASATGGLPSFIEDERSGLLVPPGDPQALAAALVRVLTGGALAARLSENAPLRAGQFRLDRTLADYEALYDELAATAAAERRR